MRTKPLPFYFGILVILLTTAIAAVGYPALRRDAGMLDVSSRGAMLWWGANTEIDLLRFELSLAKLDGPRGEPALREMRQSFDVLWSRLAMIGSGAIGERLRRFGGDEGALGELAAFLREIDPIIASLRGDDAERVNEIARRLESFHRPIRLYTLGVMREDQEIAERLRERMAWSARAITLVSGFALVAALLSLFFLMRKNRAQSAMTRISQRAAEAAVQASRAKSRFLSMMSHELRNPLNGVLGPLALLNQSEMGSRQRRLIEQASQSGHAMSQMLESLLDYGEIQDGGFETRMEPLRMTVLADMVRSRVTASTGAPLAVHVAEGVPVMMQGDADRLCQIFVNLAEFLLEAADPEAISLRFRHVSERLIGEFLLRDPEELGWKLDLLLELNPVVTDQLSSDALRPLIARGLLAALRGELTFDADPTGARIIRVTFPMREVELRRVRVFLDTRSNALAAIYRAALRSDDVIFEEASTSDAVDLVLVDAARAECDAEMAGLRSRYPKALFVALGVPGRPGVFDEVVEKPHDFEGLRAKIMRCFAPRLDEPLPNHRAGHILR